MGEIKIKFQASIKLFSIENRRDTTVLDFAFKLSLRNYFVDKILNVAYFLLNIKKNLYIADLDY
jgi:hypothetical protein